MSTVSVEVERSTGQGLRLRGRGLGDCNPPRLVATDQVGCVHQTQDLKGVGGQARAVPLMAHDHDATVAVVSDRESMRAGGVEPPLQDGAIDHDRVGQVTVPFALVDRPDVDDKGAVGLNRGELVRRHTTETPSTLLEETSDG